MVDKTFSRNSGRYRGFGSLEPSSALVLADGFSAVTIVHVSNQHGKKTSYFVNLIIPPSLFNLGNRHKSIERSFR